MRKTSGLPQTRQFKLRCDGPGGRHAEVVAAKKLACRSEMGIQPIVLKRGFLDTSKGLTLTSSEEMKTIEREKAIKQAKRDEMNAKRAATEAKKAF